MSSDQNRTRPSKSMVTAAGMTMKTPLHLTEVAIPASKAVTSTPRQVRALTAASMHQSSRLTRIPSIRPTREYEMKKPSAAMKAAAINPARAVRK
jgi:hypothetical protein